jgi:hypothetical protein
MPTTTIPPAASNDTSNVVELSKVPLSTGSGVSVSAYLLAPLFLVLAIILASIMVCCTATKRIIMNPKQNNKHALQKYFLKENIFSCRVLFISVF